MWNPLDPKNVLNPYPMYDLLRQEAPIYKAQTGEWIFTRYADIKHILTSKNYGGGNRKDWIERGVEYLAQKDIDISHIAQAMNSFILQLDPPAHTKIRRFVTDNWSKEGVERIIVNNVNELMNTISTSEFDIVTDFAAQLPSMTTAKIMGLPIADHTYLHDLATEMIKALDLYVSLKELVVLNDASKKFVAYFREKLTDNSPSEGLIKHLVSVNKLAEEPLTDNELISVFIFLFVASEETSVSFLGMSFYNIITHNLQSELITKENISLELEELLRFNSPAQLLGRIALEDTTIENHRIKKGDTLTLCIGAANRDPAVFESPNEIRLDRNPKHLTFGKGIHYCLGDWLAKLTSEISIRTFLSKFNNIKIIEEPSDWYGNLAIRGFRSLKISVS